MSQHPLVGKPAPADFELCNQKDETVKLADYVGKQPLVLFFYPKDETPGCTRQVCAFRDQYEVFQKHGAAVIGVSSDSVSSHEQFATRQRLQFPILSDPKEELRAAYQVPKSFFGLIPGRLTFLIARDGTVREVFNSALNFTGHAKRAAEVVADL